MFSSKKKENEITITSTNITTLIAEDCVIEGSIESKACIKIDGKVLGDVNSGGVILGQKGYVKGNVRTKELLVHGTIEGDAYAENLIMKATGVVLGNIQVKTLQVDTGAVYKGNVSMDFNNSVAFPTPEENED